jgi:hypothetical protein
LKHLKNIGSCIFGGEREEIRKSKKRGSMESGRWWSTFVSGTGTKEIVIFSPDERVSGWVME